MDEIEKKQKELQESSAELIKNTPLLKFLKKLGDPVQSGSSITGLMVHPDIDFAVLNDKADIQTAIDMVPALFKELNASIVKVTDFRTDDNETAVYYLGIMMPFNGLSWQIDATVTLAGYDPADAYKYLYDINAEEREAILRLKTELINARRYVGVRSQPPYTFKSQHIYEAVVDGHVRTIQELEDYSKNKEI